MFFLRAFLLPSARRALSLIALLMCTATSALGQSYTLGVPSYRPVEITRERFQPLVDYLNQHIPHFSIELRALSYADLERALTNGEIDFVLTNPAHYILLARQNSLSSPLATIIPMEHGIPVRGFAGVILVPAERDELQTIADLKGKTVAAVTTKSLGGYQMQAFELLGHGVQPHRDIRIKETGMPHDSAILTMLHGQTDAAFVRSGIMESMIREGRLQASVIRVLNPVEARGIPYAASTAVYPEWPLAALAHTNEQVALLLASALYALPHGSKLARQVGIYGFSVPADYHSVERLMRELRLPPFDLAPEFTLKDAWERWELPIALLLLVVILILLLSAALFLARRQALREQQHGQILLHRLEEAQRIARLGHWEANLVSGQLWWSDTIYAIFGFDQQTFSPSIQAFHDRVHPEDLPLVLASEERARRDGIHDVQHRIIRPDGEVRWVHELARLERDEQGNLVRLIGTVQDISAQKRVEQALTESELRLRQFAENSDTIFWVRTADIMHYISPGYEKAWGRSCQSLYDDPASFLASVWHEDRRRVQKYFDLEIAEHLPFDLVYRIQRPDGSLRWIHARSFPVYDHDGAFSCWTGVAEDVTTQKEYEDTLERFNDELIKRVEEEVSRRMATEQSYQTLFEHSPEGILLLDRTGRFCECNPAAARMLGREPDQIIGKRPQDLSSLSGNFSSQNTSAHVDAVINRSFAGDVQVFEWKATTADGGEILLEVLLSPLGAHRPDHLLVMWRDIGEIRKLQREKQLQEIALIQQSKMAELGSMMGAIAHQWKQPLNNIALYTQFLPEQLKSGELDAATLNEAAFNIMKLVNFMARTIDDFRDFFKPSEVETTFNLLESIQGVLELIGGQLLRDSVDLRLCTTCRSYHVRGVKNAFQQVILNIVNNAREALVERRTPEPFIRISCQKVAGHIHVTISDNGGGIAEHLLPDKIFEAFVTSKGDGGTGIGLSLSRSILHKMNGSIGAANTAEGACFTIHLPDAGGDVFH
ncbi:PhnD/SsuA/transferrin family substrate-binding protein [Desulfurispirillum indicum]|uniref:PhnD/SsuA/transferrin family substrate-binding protein n=1 Tax=Desulfurispirillum indicum TaxID=936456 RepID=UPI001CFB13CC|nr:PhnD/SsuA/transferrin family substrate-binding protein [Desulfurispirillum indicum]UCZ55789.1 PhnD/SsuA/transferrin family substrate-binding protein [Desulfurispirillum indicum]